MPTGIVKSAFHSVSAENHEPASVDRVSSEPRTFSPIICDSYSRARANGFLDYVNAGHPADPVQRESCWRRWGRPPNGVAC
jgi:hypothetical protein